MASFAASLLDELMGRNRNLNPKDKPKETHWSDPEVCKYFLCGFCPHELFTNTRADMGLCRYVIHDEELPKKYNASSRYMKMGYEEDYLQCLNDMIGEIDRKIRRGHQRLELNKSHTGASGPIGIHQEKLTVLSDRITELVDQAEKLGCEGRVEEAQGVLKLCDQLKEERSQLQESASNQMTPKEMEVCQVCGAFLVVGDAPQRVEEHASGKQHMGYAKVRATIDNLKKKLRGEDSEREMRLQREREERDRQKTLERERKEKERDTVEKDKKEGERDEINRDDKKERHERSSSSRKRSRSRSRQKNKKSRSRSRDRRHRSRSGGKDCRSRSRSRDRRHSRDGDRSRESSSLHSGRRSSDKYSNGSVRRR